MSQRKCNFHNKNKVTFRRRALLARGQKVVFPYINFFQLNFDVIYWEPTNLEKSQRAVVKTKRDVADIRCL